ncbi:MAG: EpsG family protein [Clostridia bacterium]|nr:EpsG family protein [Clostridia bacterium]
MIIYLVAFGLTYLFAVACRRIAPPLGQRALAEKTSGGVVFHSHRLLPAMVFLACFLPLFLLSALREGIGTDYYYTYTPRFLEILEGERTYYEIGFYWVNRIIGMFTSNPQWVFVVTSFVFMLFVALAFYDAIEDLPFCVMTLLVTGEYFISLNNLRQAMASAILLFGYRFIRKKQWVRFGLLTVLCGTLHQSMLVFLGVLLVLILLEYVPLHRLLLLLSAGAAVVLVLMNTSLDLLAPVLPDRLLYYFREAMYTEPTIGKMRILVNIVLLVFLLFTRYQAKDREMEPFVVIQFLAVWVCLFDATLPAAYRILRLFTFWQLLAIPRAVSCYTTLLHDRTWVKCILGAVLGLLCLYSLLYLGTEEVIPYHSIFH